MANNAERDENHVPTLLAVSSADGVSTVTLFANPDTHRLLVEATAGVVGPDPSTDNAIARFDGTTGETIQDSTIFISDAGLLQLAGKTSSFPALKRSTTIVQFKLADDSGYATVDALAYKASGTAPVADGTYTVGIGVMQNGTITTKGGIITAIQEAS